VALKIQLYLYAMKKLFLLLSVVSTLYAAAQPATLGMVEAEKSFAAFSVKNGTREAFLAFIDSNAVLFGKDSFTNGRMLWEARTPRPGTLNWKPVVAELSASGNWGFSTGPWTFNNQGDTATGRGHYFTIWHKAANDEWKFLFDCGAEGGVEPLGALYSFQAPKVPGTVAGMMQAERDFEARMLSAPLSAHQQYLSITSVLLRNGQPLAITPGQQSKWFRGLPASIQGRHAGHLMAPSQDMALVYGVVFINGRSEPYLRLWRNEPGGWKVAAELLRL
jgi:hypothetical protein